MTNKWKNDMDGLLLTRGQLLVDTLIQALIHHPTHFRHTIAARRLLLVNYIKRMRGDGAERIRNLKRIYLHSFDKPQDIHRLRRAAQSRKDLEAYIEKLEIACGKREPIAMRKRRKAKGWLVRRFRGQKVWRIALTSMQDGRPVDIKGSYKSRDDAEKAARAMIAKLRSEAA